MRAAQGPFPMETTYTWTAIDDTHTRMTLRNRGDPRVRPDRRPRMAAAMRRTNHKDLQNSNRSSNCGRHHRRARAAGHAREP